MNNWGTALAEREEQLRGQKAWCYSLGTHGWKICTIGEDAHLAVNSSAGLVVYCNDCHKQFGIPIPSSN